MTPSAFDKLINATAGDFKGRAVRGAAATSVAQGFKLVLQMASVVVLSRLLHPKDFGAFAMVMPIAAFVMMLQDLGLTHAIITNPKLQESQASAMFWINVGMSTILAVLLAASAPLIGLFYGHKEVTGLAVALSGAVLIAGLVSAHIALMTKAMRFGSLAALDIVSSLIGFVGSVIVATFWPSPWALVTSVLASIFTSLIMVWLMVRWVPGRPASYSEVRSMLHFGGGLTGFNLTNFISRSADQILIGRYAGAVQLGYYDRAYKLLLFPLQQITAPVARVTVPMLARIVSEPGRYLDAYRRTVQQINLVCVPGVLFLSFAAHDLIPLLLGKQWAPAVAIFAWLGLAGIHQPMTATMSWLFTTQNRTGALAKWGVVSAFSCVAAFVVGLRWGAVGVAAAYTITDVLFRLPALWWWAGREGPVRTMDMCKIAVPFVVSGVAAALVLVFVQTLGGLPPLARVMLSGAASYGVVGVTLWLMPAGRAIIRETLSIMMELSRFRRPAGLKASN